MSEARELKVVFTGPMGAGKTTAITTISDKPPVATEALNTEQSAIAKPTTTVALDYGQLLLEDGTSVGLYGTPGQERFSFMWEILCRGALGVVLLLDGSAASAAQDLTRYAEAFRRLNPTQPFVIGIGRLLSGDDGIDQYARALSTRGIVAPVFGVDVRRRRDVLLLVETLICLIEAKMFEASDGTN